jgi:hypothetical protein
MPNFHNQDLLRRYLLGDLDGEIRQKLEEELMTDESSLEELEAVEDELLDECVLGKLTPAEEEKVKRTFLSTPEREERLRFAKVFHRYAASQKSLEAVNPVRLTTAPAFLGWPVRIALFVALAIVVGGVWLYNRSTQNPPRLAMITLTPTSSSRGEATAITKVRLAPGTDVLKVVLELPAEVKGQNLRAELESESGVTKRLEVSEENSREAAVTIAASQLRPAQYALKLFAINPDGSEQRIPGSYFFTVE